ncbi:MAG: hypothetical protein ACWA44_10940 [Thiotrichales bacterium]
MDYRLIFFHKQATSARTRFLKFDYGSVLAFEPLPELATILDETTAEEPIIHPAAVLRQAAEKLGLSSDDLKAEGEFQQCVDIPGETVQVILAEITTMDPPFDLAEKAEAKFIELTQARGLPAVELQLLRAAYEAVMGG